MSVIAEGVETSEEAALVQLLGCDFIQGYFTGRPMSVDQLDSWIGVRSNAIEDRADVGLASALSQLGR
jgi:EAL domain-containing protein (putative c-di-GMP-specific phosphodiesterase class I)